YEALSARPGAADPASVLPELAGSYAGYARWQRAQLAGAALASQLDYWRRELDGAPELIALPTDRPRPPVQSSAGDRHPMHLAPELVAELEALGQRDRATLFMTLLAAFHVVLRRHSGQDDICVGTSIAARERAEWEGHVGFFTNNLVLRTRAPGDPSFRELLRAVRDTALGAYAHQDVPFETLVAELRPARSRSHAPLHQVMLLDRNAHGAAPTLSGHAAREFEVPTGTAMFDLTLALSRSAAGLDGWFEYATDLFDRATVARLAVHFTAVLQAALRDAEQRISAMPLVAGPELRTLVEDWNATAVEYSDASLVRRVAEHPVRDPGALAVVMHRDAVSDPGALALVMHGDAASALDFGELVRRAHQLAHH